MTKPAKTSEARLIPSAQRNILIVFQMDRDASLQCSALHTDMPRFAGRAWTEFAFGFKILALLSKTAPVYLVGLIKFAKLLLLSAHQMETIALPFLIARPTK